MLIPFFRRWIGGVLDQFLAFFPVILSLGSKCEVASGLDPRRSLVVLIFDVTV